MANNQSPEVFAAGDDFLEQILSIPYSYGGASSDSAVIRHHQHSIFSLGRDDEREAVNLGGLYSGFEQLQHHGVPHPVRHDHQPLHGQPTSTTVVSMPHPPTMRPRVRARRGQATDPHSIAERLRRERISERIKALQEIVPSCNKTDRAAMLDEILDYVKFLRLQVKVLSMSRLGGASAVVQLVADIPLQPVEGDKSEARPIEHIWEKWSNEETETEVAKLMEEDVSAAMQFLQTKSLCIMPISLASVIYPSHQEDANLVKSEPPAPT